MKYKKKDFNQQWFEERVEELQVANLSDAERVVIIAEAITLYLEQKINYTVLIVIINLIMVINKQNSVEIKRIEMKLKKLKPYSQLNPTDFETKYYFTMLLEELVHVLKKIV